MSIISNTTTLSEAAAALVALHDAGQLAELRDEIICARRAWHKEHLRRTVGEKVLVQSLAEFLQADEIDPSEAYAAVRDAVRPSWGATLLRTIVDFAGEIRQAEMRPA
jgi:hypothetical protein